MPISTTMKKKVILIILLLLSNLVGASHSVFIKDSLKEGKATSYRTDGGVYIVELFIVSGSSAKFKINNEEMDTLAEGESDKTTDGSQILVWKVLKGEEDEVDYFFYGSGDFPLDIELETTWDIEECNFDNNCQETEKKNNCCYDCGCETGYSCEENLCIKKTECISDEECVDDNPCSTDSCIAEKCQFIKQQGCILEDKCLAYGTTTETDYCSEEVWNKRKEPTEACVENYECLNEKCIKNKCYKRSFKGVFIALFLIILILVLITTVMYGIKKGSFKKFLKKIKDTLFWKF